MDVQQWDTLAIENTLDQRDHKSGDQRCPHPIELKWVLFDEKEKKEQQTQQEKLEKGRVDKKDQHPYAQQQHKFGNWVQGVQR